MRTDRKRAGCEPGFESRCSRSESNVTASPLAEVVGLAVDLESYGAREHDADLAAPGLVAGVGPGDRLAGSELVLRDRDALTRQIGGQKRDAMRAVAGGRPLARAHDGGGRRLVETQQLRQRQLEPARDASRGRERRRGLAALDLREHRR